MQGFEKGGRAGARATLDRFWGRMGEIGRFGPAQLSPWDRWFGHWNVDNSPLTFWVDMFSRLSSPYQFNPLNYNPLREVLQEMIELPLLRRADGIKLYVSATNVRSGKSRIFENKDMSIDVLLASTCLPQIFQAVEIGGEAYWDGGYRGNPSLYPLIYGCKTADLVIVEINPLTISDVPRNVPDIMDRVNEISFNAILMDEVRAIQFVRKLYDDEKLDRAKYKRMNIHMIANEAVMQTLGGASKMSADAAFLTYLKQVGRDTAEAWLKQNFDGIGERSTVDIPQLFL